MNVRGYFGILSSTKLFKRFTKTAVPCLSSAAWNTKLYCCWSPCFTGERQSCGGKRIGKVIGEIGIEYEQTEVVFNANLLNEGNITIKCILGYPTVCFELTLEGQGLLNLQWAYEKRKMCMWSNLHKHTYYKSFKSLFNSLILYFHFLAPVPIWRHLAAKFFFFSLLLTWILCFSSL